MKEYIKSRIRTDKLIVDNEIEIDELHRLARADSRWADNKCKEFQHRKILKGEIYQFEFGKNYAPEMSYEHRGLVLRVNGKLLYVLPIFSYNMKKHLDVYHPVDSPESKSNLYLLKSSEYSFIDHDSVLKLNDIRTVSINRILYKQNDGRLDIHGDAFKEIERLVIKKVFPQFSYDYDKLIEENERIRNDLETIKQGAN